MTRRVARPLCAWFLVIGVVSIVITHIPARADLALSREIAQTAMGDTKDWPLPPAGPVAAPNKVIVYIAENLRNSGVLGVGTGVCEAAKVIGWQCRVFDIGSLDAKREAVFSEVFALNPDGVILGGLDGYASLRFLERFKDAEIPIVGWHVAPLPGPMDDTPIAVNITTDATEVAKVAAHYVISDSDGSASVIIFTDSQFSIARKKSDIMSEIIQGCEGCKLLEVLDIDLERVNAQMPEIITALIGKYGDEWTYSLSINDLYYDSSITSLVLAGNAPYGPPFNISAGDGSPSAFLRIRSNSYQKASVPEPLLFQGWQLVDELNRLFRKEQLSGYVNPPHIVTKENIWKKEDELNLFDIDNNYRDHYTRSWKAGPNN